MRIIIFWTFSSLHFFINFIEFFLFFHFSHFLFLFWCTFLLTNISSLLLSFFLLHLSAVLRFFFLSTPLPDLTLFIIHFFNFTGKYKRTMTPFKPTTEDARDKVTSEIHEILRMFKMFITSHRPSLNVDEVATGEVRTYLHFKAYIYLKIRWSIGLFIQFLFPFLHTFWNFFSFLWYFTHSYPILSTSRPYLNVWFNNLIQ